MKIKLRTALTSPSLPPALLVLDPQEKLNHQHILILAEFILQDSKALSELKNMQNTLAYALLLEPFAFDTALIRTLALSRLTVEQLVRLIFELLPKHPESTEEEQLIIHNNVEQLIGVLAARTTKPSEYQQLISGKPQLANLLMKKRLGILADPPSQKALIWEILENYPCFDWHDEPFSALIYLTILPVFTQLSDKEFNEYFTRYYHQHGPAHQAIVTKVTKELLTSELSTQKILSSLLQDKSIHQKPSLLWAFLQIPELCQPFLTGFLTTINNQDLLDLLMFLVALYEKQQNIPGVLEKVLDCFCLKLLNASRLDNDPIHQWKHHENAPLVAKHLISQPSCIISLTGFSTFAQGLAPSLLQGILTKSPADDLKNRGIAVIESLKCTDDEFKKIALKTLCHFRQTPKTIQTLFTNLELACKDFKKVGQNHYQRFQDNYQGLKKACWELLTPNLPYDENQASTLLTLQLNTAHCFDWLLISITQQPNESNKAVYLSEIDSKNLAHLEPETLAAVLIQSNTEITNRNWSKIQEFLKTNPQKDQLAFTRALIQALISETTMPQGLPGPYQKVIEQAFKLITNLPHLVNLLVELDSTELKWLITNSPTAYLYENFPHWLDSLIHKQHWEAARGEKLLASLPADPNFLARTLALDSLAPYLPKLFLQFAKNEATTPHLVALFHQSNTLNQSDKQVFIATVQQLLFTTTETHCALRVLTPLIQSLTAVPIQDRAVKKLIRNQLRLFNQVVQHTELEQTQSAQLQQDLFNLLNFLNTHDTLWINEILNDINFAALAPLWLKTMDPTKQNDHPFTQLLLDHSAAKIHSDLLEHVDYQNYLQNLLSNPPETLTEDRFNLLFTQQLSKSNQQSLAQKLLQESTIDTLNHATRITLSRTLEIKDLYTAAISKERPTIPAIFVGLLAQHPGGLNQLSEFERNHLLLNLNDRKQLLDILNGQTATDSKINFVEHLFEFILQNKIKLSDWLERLHIDGPSFAALANYTHAPEHQTLLYNTLQSTTALASLEANIKNYVQNPSLQCAIEKKGLLHLLIQNAFLNPQTGWRCDKNLLSKVTNHGETLQKILHNQFLFLNEVHQLNDFYAPFGSCNNDTAFPFIAARWLHQLPLLSQGLLQIIQDYPKITSSSAQRALTKTRLYTELVNPLLSGELSHDLPIDTTQSPLLTLQLNEICDLLSEYTTAIKPYNRQYHEYLNRVIQTYTIKLHAIKHASFPTAIELFDPHASMGQITYKITAQNQEKIKPILDNASFLHSQQTNYHPSNDLISLLELVAQNPEWLNGSREFQTWLFNVCLTASLIAPLSASVLTKLFTHYPTDFLIELLNANKQKLSMYQASFEKFTQLHTAESLEDMLQLLLSSELTPFREVCEFAELPTLTALVNLAIQIKKTGLPYSKIKRYLLPTELSKNFELEWLKQDLSKVEANQDRLLNRHNALTMATFRYFHKDKSRLMQLPKLTFTTPNSKILRDCLHSYLPLFKTNNTDLIHQFLNTVITLLHQSPDKEAFIAILPHDLLNQMMHFALKSPEKYKLLIKKLMDSSDTTLYLALITNQLTTLISHYKPLPQPDKLTLNDLTLNEVATMHPDDFKNILFLQRLLQQVSPQPVLAQWVNDSTMGNREMRAYFAADACLYEQILHLSEQSVAANLDDQANKNYQTNLENAYDFIVHENNAFIYGKLIEELHQSITSIDPQLVYHSLNIASIIVKDDDILLPDRLNFIKLFNATLLPLDTLHRLQNHCPSKVIYPLFSLHLLSRTDFLATLPGKSLLHGIKPNSQQRLPKRLQFYVQTIDLTRVDAKGELIIPIEALELLTPEAAATLFCSVPHFHQFNTINIPILLARVGAERQLLINYWINAYSAMPNYEGVLLKLAGLYPDEITSVINKMPLSQRQKIIYPLLTQFRIGQNEKYPFKENQITALSNIINTYLTHCGKDPLEKHNRLQLAAITHQLISHKIKIDNKQVVLNQFWKNLEESNGRIIAYSLQRNTKDFIHTLSLQKNPEQLLELLKRALPHLTEKADEKIKGIVEEARREADFETRVSKLRFLKTFRTWWKRCTFYGWTGFFTPNPPTYLISRAYLSQKQAAVNPEPSSAILNELIKTTTAKSETKSIARLLDVLEAYELESKHNEEEITIRSKIDRLFTELWNQSDNTPQFKTWLSTHVTPFLTNRKALIALYCASNQESKLADLLETAEQGPSQFAEIVEEFRGFQTTIVEGSTIANQMIAPISSGISYMQELGTTLGRSVHQQITAIPEQLRALPEQLLAATDQLRTIPAQLRAIPEQLLAVPDQLRAIPGQLLAIPGGFRRYFGEHLSFFAQKPERRVPSAESRGIQP